MGVFIGQWGKILVTVHNGVCTYYLRPGNIGCEVFLGGKGINKYVDVCMLVVIKREWIQQFILKSSCSLFFVKISPNFVDSVPFHIRNIEISFAFVYYSGKNLSNIISLNSS